jgi:Adenosine deaminase
MAANSRTSRLPIEHLDAELLAAPLVSLNSFRNQLIKLESGMSGATGEIWRETEKEMLGRFPGLSIDELIVRRDLIWFGEPQSGKTRPLLDLLQDGAIRIFDPDGFSRTSSQGSSIDRIEQRRRLRWAFFALPQDLLCGSSGLSHLSVSAAMQKHLQDHGFAETHLHLKAAIDFPTLWTALQRALTGKKASPAMFESPGATFDEGREFGHWLIRCAVSRLVLAGFLENSVWRPQGLLHYIHQRVFPEMLSAGGPVVASLFLRVLAELANGRFALSRDSFDVVKQLFASLIATQSSGIFPPGHVAEFDPLAFWYRDRRSGEPERGLLSAAFAYLRDTSGKTDNSFARLFWQTQRIRVLFYRHVVQRPMTPGLQWFTRTYARLANPRRPIPLRAFVQSAVHISGPGLKSLEVRITPEESVAELVSIVEEVDLAFRELADIEAGVVFHFSRTRGRKAEKGTPPAWNRLSNEDPRARNLNPSGYRFAGFYCDRRREATALADLLLSFPRMLERVRGIDLCTDELAVPLWVMLPLVRHVRRAGGIASAILSASKNPVPPLRMTVHAGEDYVHLLGGLRRVGQSVEYLALDEGDRIGHGVALGADVERWCETVIGLTVPKGERLLDLLWARQVAMKSLSGGLHSRLAWLEHEVCRIGSYIFGQYTSQIELAAWVDTLHSPELLARTGFPWGPVPHRTANDTKDLAVSWLRDNLVFERSQQLELVHVRHEIGFLTALQSEVRSAIARKGIVVEINPTSNLLIGNLGDLAGHPLWRLCPPQGNQTSNSIRVCIGSDDPITFVTRLPEEYQLLWDSMVESGLSAYSGAR